MVVEIVEDLDVVAEEAEVVAGEEGGDEASQRRKRYKKNYNSHLYK